MFSVQEGEVGDSHDTGKYMQPVAIHVLHPILLNHTSAASSPGSLPEVTFTNTPHPRDNRPPLASDL